MRATVSRYFPNYLQTSAHWICSRSMHKSCEAVGKHVKVSKGSSGSSAGKTRAWKAVAVPDFAIRDGTLRHEPPYATIISHHVRGEPGTRAKGNERTAENCPRACEGCVKTDPYFPGRLASSVGSKWAQGLAGKLRSPQKLSSFARWPAILQDHLGEISSLELAEAGRPRKCPSSPMLDGLFYQDLGGLGATRRCRHHAFWVSIIVVVAPYYHLVLIAIMTTGADPSSSSDSGSSNSSSIVPNA